VGSTPTEGITKNLDFCPGFFFGQKVGETLNFPRFLGILVKSKLGEIGPGLEDDFGPRSIFKDP
jgi:hypothetical protein